MKSYFAYIRVSTQKQGEQGSSLQEQRAAIEAFAKRSNLRISAWFEERETAAKRGRGAFNRMLADLERNRAAGVIIHKIDRSARNLRDWSRLGELIDLGVEVHFVTDNLDLTTRGGRLSADIQAVVAADYIRNLREEVRKGFYGRLKQGFYPLPAPHGYVDRGRAKVKDIDPVKGPLMAQAFELYATGNYSLHMLREEMASRGLVSPDGRPMSVANLARLLHNPFYIGLMRIGTTGEVFEGKHVPLVSREIFDRVQNVLGGRLYPRVQIHQFRFRRLVRCVECGRSLIGERRKGHVYYRCHSISCRGTCVREEDIDAVVRAELALVSLSPEDVRDFGEVIAELAAKHRTDRHDVEVSLRRELVLLDERLERATDAVIEGLIDKETFESRKGALILQRLHLKERLETGEDSTIWQIIAERVGRANTAQRGYDTGTDDEKRKILKTISSDLLVRRKTVEFPMYSPFAELREWAKSENCGPSRGAARTSEQVLARRRQKRVKAFIKRLAQRIAEEAPASPLSP